MSSTLAMAKENTKKVREAAVKARQIQEPETKTYLTPNDMINEAVSRDFAGLLKAKRLRDGHLDIRIVKQDARTPMYARDHTQL